MGFLSCFLKACMHMTSASLPCSHPSISSISSDNGNILVWRLLVVLLNLLLYTNQRRQSSSPDSVFTFSPKSTASSGIMPDTGDEGQRNACLPLLSPACLFCFLSPLWTLFSFIRRKWHIEIQDRLLFILKRGIFKSSGLCFVFLCLCFKV